MAIYTKSNAVIFTELTPGLAFILYGLEKFHRQKKVNQPDNLWITSIADFKGHVVGSRHYTNEAVDVRSKNFNSREDKRIFRAELEMFLGPFFRVLLENEGGDNEHFHIQVKKGLKYP
jgi:hypothetical protein